LFHTTKDKPSMIVCPRHRFSTRSVELLAPLGLEYIGVSDASRGHADAA